MNGDSNLFEELSRVSARLSACPGGAWPYEFKEKLMPQIGELVRPRAIIITHGGVGIASKPSCSISHLPRTRVPVLDHDENPPR